MSNKYINKKSKLVRKLFKKWTYLLGLRWWHVSLTIITDPQEINEAFRDSEYGSVVATSHADWRYLDAEIKVNMPALAREDKSEIERVIVHELCHVLVNEMREEGIDHEERVASTLASAFLWTRNIKDAN